MSRIFESLRQAELATAKREQLETSAASKINVLDRRKTRRARVEIPLLIYGYTPQNTPFLEKACTIEINARGALIAMKTALPRGERLLLTNETNNRTQECTILAVTASKGPDLEVAIAFATPSPSFWRKVSQPPPSQFGGTHS